MRNRKYSTQYSFFLNQMFKLTVGQYFNQSLHERADITTADHIRMQIIQFKIFLLGACTAEFLIMHHYFGRVMQGDLALIALISAERDQKATLDWIWLQQALELNKDALSTVQPSGNASVWSLRANDINEVH